ncbi:variable surface protein [Plasmodium gonderi]|uniref:Variable surface protein n=1 Tax=Plasmodium gonderi TaxID=77519 RepID=A0A1Y1JVX3_PLAGO|nr:variable surface protein [Plasmodium gonderi]GAW84503.1 variable surface protein [Plasmodium gonderi]
MSLFINYNDIFPLCTEGFKWEINYHRPESIASALTEFCSNFYNNVETCARKNAKFSQHCQVHTLYLENINNNKSISNVKTCCIYFFYKLNELLEKFSCHCEETNNCYQKMVNLSISWKKNDQISELFYICNRYINELNKSEIPIFKNLDEICSNYDKFKKKIGKVKDILNLEEVKLNCDTSIQRYPITSALINLDFSAQINKR